MMIFEKKLNFFPIFSIIVLFSQWNPPSVAASAFTSSQNVECVETLADYKRYNWTQTSQQFKYALTSDDLPGDLQGRFEGEGIFYAFQDTQIPEQIIVKPAWAMVDTGPVYLYIKYYGHIADTKYQVMCVRPVANAIQPIGCKDGVDLKPTSNWTWNEILIEMDYDKALHDMGLRIAQLYFKEGDFFLMDRVAIVQGGDPISDVDEIKNLCSWIEPPITTTTTTTTTDRPDFVCKEEGKFPDPDNCTKYHVCQHDNQGKWWDSVLTCPITTVWCQDICNCEKPDVCPCTGLPSSHVCSIN